MAVEYQLITARDSREIASAVTRAIADGWQCQDGVAITWASFSEGGGEPLYAQAMLRLVDDR
jgi:hypothetical protein